MTTTLSKPLPSSQPKFDPAVWTDADRDGLTVAATAARLGVHRNTVQKWRRRLGLSRPDGGRFQPACKTDPAVVAALAAKGWRTDEIAAHLGVKAKRVSAVRLRLGMSAYRKAAVRAAEAAALLDQGLSFKEISARLGMSVESARQACGPSPGRGVRAAMNHRRRHQSFAELASSYGLPPDLDPVAVSVVLVLLNGPATRAVVVRAIHPERSYWYGDKSQATKRLRALVRRGLAFRIPADPVEARGIRSGPRWRYALTPHALDLIAAAPAADAPAGGRP